MGGGEDEAARAEQDELLGEIAEVLPDIDDTDRLPARFGSAAAKALLKDVGGSTPWQKLTLAVAKKLPQSRMW